MNGSAVTKTDVRRAIRELGLVGKPVCLHSSLRSFGRVEGGADTVIDAFLDEGCTMMVPSHSYFFAVGAPSGRHPERNGWDYEHVEAWPGKDRIFATDLNDLSAEMGAIPAALLNRGDRIRGNNPLDSLAAIGPLAAELISSQSFQDVHAPFERLCEMGGFALLIGVGLDTLTLLHYAEQVAGRRPFIRWANGPDGHISELRTGGCSDGFPKLAAALSTIERTAQVGSSQWRAFPASALVEIAVHEIQADPSITRCSPECRRCNDAVLGGPLE